MPTSQSLTHTQARIKACKRGARGATMPGITATMMERTLNVDYRKVKRLTVKTAQLLSKATSAVIQTDAATLQLDLTGRKGFADTGIITRPGDFSNLPAGEAYVAPVEARSHGSIVIDGSFASVGLLKKKIRIVVDKGGIVNLLGNQQLNALFKKSGRKERILCEFGIGTNMKARVTGNVLEDEKALGTVHIAFGNNLGFGGKNDAGIHLDGVVRKPNVWIDGTPIINKGRFLI
jgi:leucyl aminopeptidase (aminopeptidase T)